MDQTAEPRATLFGDSIFFETPGNIIIDRDSRQRRKVDLEDLKESILLRGIMNPLIVRKDLRLVAGERRLQCAIELGLAAVPCRLLESMDETEAQIVELEENLKRKDLEWQDQCQAIGRIHQLYKGKNPDWLLADTAEALGIAQSWVSRQLSLFAEMEAGNSKIVNQPRATAAYNMILRKEQRESAKALEELISSAPEGAVRKSSTTDQVRDFNIQASVKPEEREILNQSFLDWAPGYSGEKFNFIHCDFPYGIDFANGEQGGKGQEGVYEDSKEVYFELLDCFVKNFENFAGHSCHLIFWFSMRYYEATRQAFRNHLPSMEIVPNPLVWGKTDNAGIIGDYRRNPRHIYETAFFGFRGGRHVVESVGDFYGAPTDRALHPSAKPEPMLRHFFRLAVDDSTSILDPTCGAGSALRAADSMGAGRVLGLEIDPAHCESARIALSNSRKLRKASK